MQHPLGFVQHMPGFFERQPRARCARIEPRRVAVLIGEAYRHSGSFREEVNNAFRDRLCSSFEAISAFRSEPRNKPDLLDPRLLQGLSPRRIFDALTELDATFRKSPVTSDAMTQEKVPPANRSPVK